MNDFIDKWKTDKRFRTKTKLIIYTLFVVFVSIYALTGTRNINNSDYNNNLTKKTYNYQMNINLNNKIYKYTGTKNEEEITINKTTNDITTKYIYKDNKYYKNENNVYVLVEEKEVYDTIEFNYLSINTINKYLKISTPREKDNIVYLRDIIIGNNSEEYIVIEKKEDYYNIDYTQLIKLFKTDIEKLTVEIIIE